MAIQLQLPLHCWEEDSRFSCAAFSAVASDHVGYFFLFSLL